MDNGEVNVWCPGFKPVSLDHEPVEGHTYAMRRENRYMEAPKACPACAMKMVDYHQELDRREAAMRSLSARMAREAASEAPEPIHQVLMKQVPGPSEEPVYAASGEA